MKKIRIIFFALIIFFCLSVSVNAKEYNAMELIPVDTKATVKLKNFEYSFVVQSEINARGNTKIIFDSIKNNSKKQLPVTFSILLFDSNKKNIGYLSYCSEKDVGSEYAKFILEPNATTPYYVIINPKYLINGVEPKDVKFVAIHTENEYCSIGGSANYQRLTIEEIKAGKIGNETENIKILRMKGILGETLLGTICIIITIIFIVVIIEGIFINLLHKKMYNEGNILAFVPIFNNYLAIQLSFGESIAKIYLAIIIFSLPIALFLPVLTIFASLLCFSSLIIVIIKLITKNYSIPNGTVNPTTQTTAETNSVIETTVNDSTPIPQTNIEPNIVQDNTVNNYQDINTINNQLPPSNVQINQNQETNIVSQEIPNNTNNNVNEEESDLSKLFQ